MREIKTLQRPVFQKEYKNWLVSEDGLSPQKSQYLSKDNKRRQWVNYHILDQTALCQVKYFKLFLTRNVATDVSLSGLGCAHGVHSGSAKNTAVLTDGVKKKQTSVHAEVAKSSISHLHRWRLKYLEKVSQGLSFTHTFLPNAIPGGKVHELGSWTMDSDPSLPGGTKNPSEWQPPGCSTD